MSDKESSTVHDLPSTKAAASSSRSTAPETDLRLRLLQSLCLIFDRQEEDMDLDNDEIFLSEEGKATQDVWTQLTEQHAKIKAELLKFDPHSSTKFHQHMQEVRAAKMLLELSPYLEPAALFGEFQSIDEAWAACERWFESKEQLEQHDTIIGVEDDQPHKSQRRYSKGSGPPSPKQTRRDSHNERERRGSKSSHAGVLARFLGLPTSSSKQSSHRQGSTSPTQTRRNSRSSRHDHFYSHGHDSTSKGKEPAVPITAEESDTDGSLSD